jgi:hypothetical protein
MFIEIDVVEHNEADIPYTTIMINLSSIAQIQPINKRQREQYTISRNVAIEKQLTDPNVKVSSVEELPNSGAIMILHGGHQVYHTVTPYAEIRDAILKLQGSNTTT